MIEMLHNLRWSIPLAVAIVGVYALIRHRRDRTPPPPVVDYLRDALPVIPPTPAPTAAPPPWPDDELVDYGTTQRKIHRGCIRARRDGAAPCEACRPLLVGSADGLPR